MAKEEAVRVARLGPHTIAMGFTPPKTCGVCEKEPPYVIFVNDVRKVYTWLCETCFEKGYPKMYEEGKMMEEIQGDIISIPDWSKYKNMGG